MHEQAMHEHALHAHAAAEAVAAHAGDPPTHAPPDAAAAEHAQSAGGSHLATCASGASGCCMASLLFDPPSIAAPGLAAAVTFPALVVPAPAFVAGGQERPPRAT
jgi:hypothetical protein